MKKIPSFILFLFFSQVTLAQQILQNSLSGGTNSNGAVISYTLQNNQISTIGSLEGDFLRVESYNIDPGQVPSDLLNTTGLTLGLGGMLYEVHKGINYFGNDFKTQTILLFDGY